MIGKNCIFITQAMFFETRTPKHKPILVSGRDFYSLTYRYSGNASISVGYKKFVSGNDSITFMPKGLSYTTEVNEDVHMAVIHFDFNCADIPSEPAVIDGANTTLRSLFKALVKNSTDTAADFSKMSILYEIFAELDKMSLSENQKMIPHRIERSKELMDANFCNPYFSVTGLAENIGVSSAYLRREFHVAYGISPLAYLKGLRIEKAKLLLLTEQISIAQISAECGYTCPSYFIQDFHKVTGESPGNYRGRLLESP